MSQQQSLLSSDALRPSERRFISVMQELGYGRFESLKIQKGEVVLVPWPSTIRSVKFGNATGNQPCIGFSAWEVKKQVAELLAYVRGINDGTIRVLEIRGGLPFSMEIAEVSVHADSGSV